MLVSRLFFLGAGTKVKEAENRYHQAFDRSKKHHLSEIWRKDKGGAPKIKSMIVRKMKRKSQTVKPPLRFY